MDYIQSLVDAGSDAQKNLFEVEFIDTTQDILDDRSSTSFTLRTSKITLPTLSQETYNKKFLSVDVDFPKASYTGNKQITLSFRIDANYEVYKNLLRLQAKTAKPSTGFVDVDVENTFHINVYTFAKNNETKEFIKNTKPFYSFEYCWIEDLKAPGFSYDSANTQEVTATINFMKHSHNV